LASIKELSGKSLEVMASLFEDGIKSGAFINKHPTAIADIVWSMFSGVILWEESKRVLNDEKNYLKETLETAFEILSRGLLT
jgi:hypothetical protein